jgi:hypothetical protein
MHILLQKKLSKKFRMQYNKLPNLKLITNLILLMEIAQMYSPNRSLLNSILRLLEHHKDFIKAANSKILKNIFEENSSKMDI